ncbi:MAG: uroporphyrinogen decarboxylase family protein [Armatimonadota bacterium]
MMTNRENWLRAIEFRTPEWIPAYVGFAPIVWKIYRNDLERVMLDHPRLFSGFEAGHSDFYDQMSPYHTQGVITTDNWGCVWHNEQEGLEGLVVQSPLADWAALETYQPPDVETLDERGPRDWGEVERDFARAREAGGLLTGNGERLFDRLYFLRGFENLMIDLATDDPHLPRLVEMLTEHELRLIHKWLEVGVDAIYFHTDIGSQRALMIHPDKFRKYLKPMFTTLFQACRQAGVHVCLSSDGHVLEIVDDLIECGISMHDPQLRANTLEGIKRCYKGKVCCTVDLDRQSFAFLSPQGIREQVAEVVEAMYDPAGGLMLSGSVWGNDVPLENIAALCEAVEEHCFD